MSKIVVLIGYILTIPSILGLLIAGIMFIASIGAGASVSTQAVNQAEATGAVVGAGLSIMLSAIIGVLSLIGGLLGYLLIMKKKVYRCITCGFIIDRS